MTASTRAYFLAPLVSGYHGSAGMIQPGLEIPEGAPSILWGQGTPNGDLAPFNQVNKGSLYLLVNATDDESCVYVKVDEGGDDDDWVLLFADGHALIANADIADDAAIAFSKLAELTDAYILVGSSEDVATAVAVSGDISLGNDGAVAIASGVIVDADVNASAAIVGSKLATNARRLFLRSKTFNIDNGAGTTDDDIMAVPTDGVTLVAARVVYVEATDAEGAAGANVKLGTTVGGAELVAATNLEVSKAVGTYTDLTFVTGAGAISANGMIAVRHTGIAAAEGGQYYVQLELTVDD